MSYRFPLSSSAASGVVFFKITNIEHDVLDIAQTPSGPDTYFAATMGELGCWVDPKVTQMMQTGLEHSRVPDVVSYLGVGGFPFHFSRQDLH
jgi:peroxin-6